MQLHILRLIKQSKNPKVIAINTTAAQYLAEVCDEFNVQLLHVSTDFVFDGLALDPYLETDSPNQQSVYGQQN
jgi:dTDP-4-dehydrorhamnose reductase